MIISNAKIILEKKVISGSLVIEEGKIKAIQEGGTPPHGTALDIHGAYLAPGIIELHSHGAAGCDFLDGGAEPILQAAKAHLAHGVTTLLATTLACPLETLIEFFSSFREVVSQDVGNLYGIHLEGPFFSLQEKGAQEERFIIPINESFYNTVLSEAGSLIKRWSLAPELEGAEKMLDDLRDTGILFSAAHTSATYDDISRAYDHGLTMLTHFYSGMSGIKREKGRRILGAIESGYLIDDLYVELICDGYHLPPELLNMIFKLKKHEKITATSDSMRAAGMPDGPSVLGPKDNGLDVIVEDGVAKLLDRSAYAGSVTIGNKMAGTLFEKAGRTMPEIFNFLSLNPARALGLEETKGSIEIGKDADLIVFDDEFNIQNVFLKGERRI